MTTTTVDDLLASYRAAATTKRDKGTYFERLCSAFLTADPVQGEQYEQVWHWAEWVTGEGAAYAGANGWTGKPAIEWVMERQAVKTDTKSGITNDANRYATETVGDPRYPFDLLCRVITVSLETVAIVKALPKLDI